MDWMNKAQNRRIGVGTENGVMTALYGLDGMNANQTPSMPASGGWTYNNGWTPANSAQNLANVTGTSTASPTTNLASSTTTTPAQANTAALTHTTTSTSDLIKLLLQLLQGGRNG